MADVTGGSPGGGRALLKLGVLVLILVGGLMAVRFTPLGGLLTREGIAEAIALLRGSIWAPLIFMALYATLTALAVPGTILTLAGGAMFGLFWGVIFISIAANVGASLAFLVARFLGREGVERIAGARLQRLDDATREHGFQGLLILRLVPLVPFNALNFGSGLTAMRWRTYATATVVGILPGTIVYTMFADALLQGSQEASRDAFIRALISGALLVFLSLLPAIMKKLNIRVPHVAPLLATLGVLGTVGASAQDIPDHQTFTTVLGEVVEQTLVDYAALKASRATLDRYLEELEKTDPGVLKTSSNDTQLAFWINAYNACMLRIVIDHYPIQKNTSLLERVKNAISDRPENSVWQIPDVFTVDHCTVAGAARSQDEIEHEIIRPMGDPRIHFAVNCAALSCPPLRTEAYTPENLDAQLDDNVDRFVRNPRHFRVDRESGEVRLNKVLDWFGDDFGGRSGLRTFFASYLDGDTAAFMADPDTDIAFFDYDWTLNDLQN
jgi:uncharacterized membrane protein YdjX (TVP38/TMEM64 family)